MKHDSELLILEGDSALGGMKLVKPHMCKVYYISPRRKKWYHPSTIWNGICKVATKVFSLFK